MSKLKADKTFVFGEECEAYKKSEADKVIAELEESHKKEVEQLLIETKRLENLCASYRHDCDNFAIREANALKEIGRDNRVIRHQQYKRCLAMARWCLTESVYFHYRYDDWGDKGYDRPYKWKKVVFWKKWARYWLELAEKFKEAK